MVVTDPLLRRLPSMATVLEFLEKNGIEFSVFDGVRVEPADESCLNAAHLGAKESLTALSPSGAGRLSTPQRWRTFTLRTPRGFLGLRESSDRSRADATRALKPSIAVPTTAGTGSETIGTAIFDYCRMHAKTGVAHRRFKPTLGILDPENTATAPPLVAACTGLDGLSNAVESYTTLPYTQRPQPDRPAMRPAYQGPNPISDIWSLEALCMVAEYLPRAVEDPSDGEARAKMILAASYAGVGFGNAGVHLPHGMSYPVSGMVRGFQRAGYAIGYPIVPHGMSVILNAPAVFRYTTDACAEPHLQAAEALGSDISRTSPRDAGKILAGGITGFIERLGMPNGLGDRLRERRHSRAGPRHAPAASRYETLTKTI